MRPVGKFRDTEQHVAHPAGIEIAQRIGLAARIDQNSRLAEEVEAKLHRVLAGPMRQLVDEGLEDKSERVGTRRAQRPGRHAKLHQRLAIFDVGDEQRRKFVGVHGRGIGELAAPPEGHEMIAQGDKPAVIVETTLEEVEARRPVEIVLHVVLAVPHAVSPARRPASRSRPLRP